MKNSKDTIKRLNFKLADLKGNNLEGENLKWANIKWANLNKELDIIAEEQKDQVISYCENCGILLVHKEGLSMKFDDGSWQKLFCSNCYDLQVELQLNHV